MNSFGMVNTPYAFNLIDVHDLCRICGNINNTFTSIFEDDGNLLDISTKINQYLPITVRRTDFLPLKICSACAHTLLTFHDFYVACQSANARLLNMLGCESQDPNYSYDTAKQITTDPTELLEIQSSFSREIENEILQMHNAKNIENEIAADAAATELERIGGSFGDGSFVGANENGEDREANNIVLTNLDQQVKPELANTRLSNGHKERKSGKMMLNGAKNRKSDYNRENMTEKSTDQEKKNRRNSKEESAAQNETVASGSGQENQLKDVNGTTDDTKNGSNSKSDPPKQIISPRKRPNGLSPKSNRKPKLKWRSQNTQKRNHSNKTMETSPLQVDSIKKSRKSPKDTLQSDSKSADENNASEPVTKCEHCPDEFKNKNKLIEHLKNFHNDIIFMCEMCNEYVAIANFMAHMLNHALQANKVAGPTAASQTDSPPKTQPIRRETPPPEAEKQNNDESKENVLENALPKSKLPVNCTECDRQFADRTGLRYHINHFHNKVKNYECDLCGRYFSCKRIITNHLLGVHLREKRLVCDQCPKRFSTDSALYMHRKVHSDILLFTCQICKRKFRSLTKLKVHITTHTKEKNYFCAICNKGFAIRNNLTKHMHTHSKSFDFKCHKCDYAANQRRYLFEHIKRSHKN